MPRDKLADKKIYFTVDSRLLGELGERLVRRSYIALSELVKNAYDADATKTTIKFINAKGEQDGTRKIYIIDNGNGMTFDEVHDYWMRIATSYKRREPISPIYGRRKTGEKGIGRFACRRLARKLGLKTIAKKPNSNKLERTEVMFVWKKFAEGTKLDEIPCSYKTKLVDDGSPGLTLELIDLAEDWSERNFNTLRRQILLLSLCQPTRRRGYKEDPGFEVVFDAPEFEKGTGALIDQFMDAGWGKISGRVNEDGTAILGLEAKKIGNKTYMLPDKFESLRGISYEIAWVPIKKEYYRDPRTLSKAVAEEIMKEGGVRVYLDGFRVYPYGDPGNDWLEIDKDVARRSGMPNEIFRNVATNLKIIDFSRSMLNHPRNSSLIGRVFIHSSPQLPFDVKADREGFVENDAYESLKRFIRLGLQWATFYYDYFLVLRSEEKLEEAEKELERELGIKPKETTVAPIDKSLNLIETVTKNVNKYVPKDELKVPKESVKAAAEHIRRSVEYQENEINLLRDVFSVNQLFFGFVHEVRDLYSNLDTHANTAQRLAEKLPKKQKREFEEFADSLRKTSDRFDEMLESFGIIKRAKLGATRKPILVKKTLKKIVKSFDYVLSYYKIKPDINIPDYLRTGPMLESEFFSIIVNLLSNSIKAVIAGKGNKILVEGERAENATIIRIHDDGVGLSKEFWEDVFQPLVTDPEGKIYSRLQEAIGDKTVAALGTGTGVGLSIVRGIAKTYGGTVNFMAAKRPWKTCVEVKLP